jgi:hypothetical protein
LASSARHGHPSESGEQPHYSMTQGGEWGPRLSMAMRPSKKGGQYPNSRLVKLIGEAIKARGLD